MLKKILLAAVIILTALGSYGASAHDEQHLSDWIGENKLKDPYTNDECCGPRDCHAVNFGGVFETADGYYVAELEKTVPSSRVIWKSPDAQWWLCMQWLESPEGVNTGWVTRQLRCLIGPPRSS